MKQKPIVCYLFTKFGYDHDLIISYKLVNKAKIKDLNEKFYNIDYQVFIDPVTKNDFDFGTYKRISEKFMDRDILFINSHSYPICDDWLKKLMKYKGEKTLIGTSASNESLYSSIKLKKKYKIFSYLIKKYRFT